jgi:hypothetical protein
LAHSGVLEVSTQIGWRNRQRRSSRRPRRGNRCRFETRTANVLETGHLALIHRQAIEVDVFASD